MLQQLIALGVIFLIILRLFYLKSKKRIGSGDFVFWFLFWVGTFALVVGIKWIDSLVASLGFSASGIEVLLYIAVLILFYSNFRMRIKLEKMERNVTKIVREISINNEKKI